MPVIAVRLLDLTRSGHLLMKDVLPGPEKIALTGMQFARRGGKDDEKPDCRLLNHQGVAQLEECSLRKREAAGSCPATLTIFCGHQGDKSRSERDEVGSNPTSAANLARWRIVNATVCKTVMSGVGTRPGLQCFRSSVERAPSFYLGPSGVRILSEAPSCRSSTGESLRLLSERVGVRVLAARPNHHGRSTGEAPALPAKDVAPATVW